MSDNRSATFGRWDYDNSSDFWGYNRFPSTGGISIFEKLLVDSNFSDLKSCSEVKTGKFIVYNPYTGEKVSDSYLKEKFRQELDKQVCSYRPSCECGEDIKDFKSLKRHILEHNDNYLRRVLGNILSNWRR